MRVLLDTHTFLWWVLADPKLSVRARRIIGGGNGEVYLSAVSAWEIAIKAGLRQLNLPDRNPEQFVAEQIRLNGFRVLPIELSHTLRIFALPNHHRDPFDRMLVAQAMVEEMSILTNDSKLREYPISVVW